MTGRGEPTDSNGNYLIKGLAPADDYRVDVWADGYANMFYNGVTMWDEATLVDISTSSRDDIDFSLSSGNSITGTITVPDDSSMNDIWVNAWSETAGGMGTSVFSSDFSDNGDGTWSASYTIPGLMPATDFKVDVWSPNFQHVFYSQSAPEGVSDWMQASTVTVVDGQDTENIDFELSAGLSISGTVLADGNPVSNVWVNAGSENAGSWSGGMTNSNGEYTIPGLASASDYRVDVWVEGFVGQFYDGQTDWNQADLVDVTLGDVTGINFTLSAGVYIEGTITLPEGETNFNNMWVNAWSDSTGMGRGEPVNSDGTYEITGLGSASDYKVDVWSDEFGHKFYSTSGSVSDWMQATPISTTGGSVTDIDITLSGGNSISGTISGVSSGDWVWVNAWSDSMMSGNGTEVTGTGSDVSYTIKGLDPANDYKVEIHSDNYQNQFYNAKTDWMQADLVDVSSESQTGINFTLSTGASISGTVTADGQPVANVWVDAWSENGSWGGANTDSNGDFTINGLTDGVEYNVNIWHPDYANQNLTVTTGTADAGNAAFTLGAGVSISGTVTAGGQGVSNA